MDTQSFRSRTTQATVGRKKSMKFKFKSTQMNGIKAVVGLLLLIQTGKAQAFDWNARVGWMSQIAESSEFVRWEMDQARLTRPGDQTGPWPILGAGWSVDDAGGSPPPGKPKPPKNWASVEGRVSDLLSAAEQLVALDLDPEVSKSELKWMATELRLSILKTQVSVKSWDAEWSRMEYALHELEESVSKLEAALTEDGA